MKHKFPLYQPFLLGLLLLLGMACTDILEKDLTKEIVSLKAPANGLQSNLQSQTFWWNDLSETIDGYRLEIVSPGFDSIIHLVEQVEITEGNTYTTSLSPGIYQWTVIGFNNSSETPPMIYDLVIYNDSTADLGDQMLSLLSPNADATTNNTNVNFLWQKLEEATAYKIQVASPDFTNSTFFVANETLTGDNFSATLPEGIYRWRVRAENETSITSYSERILNIDLTPPDAPILLHPTNGDTISLPTMLTWEVDASSNMDTLYIYSDASLSTLLLKEAGTATFFEVNGLTAMQEYYWRLRSVDEAGNTSDFSSTNHFYVE